jgi:phage FluMu protein Com
MEEVRCNSCHQLLFKAKPDSQAEMEVVCKKCKRLAKIVLPLQNWLQRTPTGMPAGAVARAG